jgi:hypothetical protein
MRMAAPVTRAAIQRDMAPASGAIGSEAQYTALIPALSPSAGERFSVSPV